MPRFQIGQKVFITGAIPTKYRGRQATVVAFRPNNTAPGVTIADKYIVRFEEGDEGEFFEIQLVAIEKRKKDA